MAETMETTLIEDLPVELTEPELLAKANASAELWRKGALLEEEKKRITADYKTRIDGIKDEIALLSDQIRSRKELRPVECFERRRPDEMMIDVIRKDSYTVVRSREMTAQERQEKLPLTRKSN